jgi:hypothetical protein
MFRGTVAGCRAIYVRFPNTTGQLSPAVRGSATDGKVELEGSNNRLKPRDPRWPHDRQSTHPTSPATAARFFETPAPGPNHHSTTTRRSEIENVVLRRR